MEPVSGVAYTLRTILKALDLRDGPSLGFMYRGTIVYIQDSHITNDQLLSVDGLAGTEWTYLRTTREWIPIFRCTAQSTPKVLECLDIEEYYEAGEQHYWVTPKGFPRENPIGRLGLG